MLLLLVAILSMAAHAPAAPLPLALSTSIAQTTEIPKGQIVEKVACLSDPAQSYALYLPSNYSPGRKWPVLYAFDPFARGKSPVAQFREAAEKYGWIVVGSNNSRNGPLQPSVEAWNAMLRDTHSRFAVDDERVYVTGLSGGARAATQIAILCHDCAAGVIACSAGFPVGVAPAPSMHFLFFGSTGVDDFNFPELRTLEAPLTKAGIKHHIRVFDGRHEWAPPAIATEAVEWMELQAVKDGGRKRDEALIEGLWQRKLQQARALEEAKKTYDAYQCYLEMAESFIGLRNAGDVDRKVSQLRDSREVKDAIREEQRQIIRQRDFQEQLSSLIAARESRRELENSAGNPNRDDGLDPGTRLQGMLSELRKQSKVAEDTGDRRVARRVLEGIFIGLFEQGLNSLQTLKRYDDAARTFSLMTEVNPDRAGGFYYLAWAYAANGDKKKSLQALKTAVEKGFSDIALLSENKAFDSIRNDPQYAPLVQRMKDAPAP